MRRVLSFSAAFNPNPLSPFSPTSPTLWTLTDQKNCKVCKNSSLKHCYNGYQDGTTQSWARCMKTRTTSRGKFHSSKRQKLLPDLNQQDTPACLSLTLQSSSPAMNGELLSLHVFPDLMWTSWMKPLTSTWDPWIIFFGQPMGVLNMRHWTYKCA